MTATAKASKSPRFSQYKKDTPKLYNDLKQKFGIKEDTHSRNINQPGTSAGSGTGGRTDQQSSAGSNTDAGMASDTVVANLQTGLSGHDHKQQLQTVVGNIQSRTDVNAPATSWVKSQPATQLTNQFSQRLTKVEQLFNTPKKRKQPSASLGRAPDTPPGNRALANSGQGNSGQANSGQANSGQANSASRNQGQSDLDALPPAKQQRVSAREMIADASSFDAYIDLDSTGVINKQFEDQQQYINDWDNFVENLSEPVPPDAQQTIRDFGDRLEQLTTTEVTVVTHFTVVYYHQ